MGGPEARVGAHPSPIWKKVFPYFVAFCYLFSMLGPFSNVFYLWRRPFATFSPCGRPLWGDFLGLPPPPTKISAGAHEYRYDIAAH